MFLSRLEDAMLSVRKDAKSLADSKVDSIVEDVNEYIFDLFDANLMDDYHIMEEFENHALAKFDSDSDEFTFEQENEHKNFLRLFEQLITQHLLRKGYNIQSFYDIVKDILNTSESRRKECTYEVIEVISYFTDFYSWATDMRLRCRELRNNGKTVGFDDYKAGGK
jgi:hypothetical protein